MTVRRATLRRMLLVSLLVPTLLIPTLALSACAPWVLFPSDSASPTASGAATPTAAPTTTPAPAPAPAPTPAPTGTGTSRGTPPPDETSPPLTGDRVISSRVTQDWIWPGPDMPIQVTHDNPVPIAPPPAPPLPYLYTIGVGAHPSDTPPYDQMSFRFKGGFPGYELMFVPELDGDASGLPIPMPGTNRILRVVFTGAQAHTEQGEPSIVSAPASVIGFDAITRYSPAGDFEGYVTYGIGVGRPMDTVPQTPVRVYEVEKIEQGERLYVVAIQIDATMWR